MPNGGFDKILMQREIKDITMNTEAKWFSLRSASVLAVEEVTVRSVAGECVRASWTASSGNVNSWMTLESWADFSRIPTNAVDCLLTAASMAKTVMFPCLQNKCHGLDMSYLLCLDSVSGNSDCTIDLVAHASSCSGTETSQQDRFLRGHAWRGGRLGFHGSKNGKE